MDHPDLIVPVVVGDGEAETGPTATCEAILSVEILNAHIFPLPLTFIGPGMVINSWILPNQVPSFLSSMLTDSKLAIAPCMGVWMILN